MIKHDAIIILYPSVKSVVEDGDTTIAYDVEGNIVSWDADAVTTKETELLTDLKLGQLRHERNAKLAETDWTQSRDVTLTNDADWATYRQALRDITDTYSDLDSVVWPTKPE